MSAKCSRCQIRDAAPGLKTCDVCREQKRTSRRKPPPPPESETRAKGGHMVPTQGPRDDTCARYTECLTAHVRAHKGRREEEVPARCPFGCRFYQEEEQAPATAYVSLNGEAHGQPTVARKRRAA